MNKLDSRQGVPKGWAMTKLNAIGQITGGGTPDSTNLRYWGGDVLWAVPTDITKLLTNYIHDTERKITKLGLKNSSAKLLPAGTVLITTRATIGECAITAKSISTNQGFQNITCNNNFDNLYVFYMIKYNTNKLLRMSYGTTFLEISKSTIKNIKIKIPKQKFEQTKIASILSGVDALIELTQQMVDKTKQLKKGLTKTLLTRGIGHTEFITKILGNVAEFTSGEFLATKDYNRGKIPVYGGNGISGHHNKELIAYDTIIFGRVGAYCGSIHFSNGKSWVTDNAIFIRNLSEHIIIEYLYRFLSHLNIRLLAEVSAQPKITQDILTHIKIRFPSIDKQRKIASILSGVDAVYSHLVHVNMHVKRAIFLMFLKSVVS